MPLIQMNKKIRQTYILTPFYKFWNQQSYEIGLDQEERKQIIIWNHRAEIEKQP